MLTIAGKKSGYLQISGTPEASMTGGLVQEYREIDILLLGFCTRFLLN